MPPLVVNLSGKLSQTAKYRTFLSSTLIGLKEKHTTALIKSVTLDILYLDRGIEKSIFAGSCRCKTSPSHEYDISLKLKAGQRRRCRSGRNKSSRQESVRHPGVRFSCSRITYFPSRIRTTWIRGPLFPAHRTGRMPQHYVLVVREIPLRTPPTWTFFS